MKPSLLLLLLILPSVLAAGMTVNDTYSSANCGGSVFSCGNSTDEIVNVGGTFNATITDDGMTDYLCAVFISGNNATAKTCIARQGLTNTSCDGVSNVLLGNHSDYYVCPSGLNCGWGKGSIPLLGTPSPTRAFQIDTSVANSQELLFVSFNCTTGDQRQSATQYLRTVSSKGVTCSGNDYVSAVFDQFGTGVLGRGSCATGSFCEPSYARNYSALSIVNDTFCTPGCYDNLKNGGETDVDYGGSVCGNCTGKGKANDEYYPIARELQEENGVRFTAATPFNATYCPAAQEASGGIFGTLAILLLVSAVMIILLLLIISGVGTAVVAGIVIFLKNRRKEKP